MKLSLINESVDITGKLDPLIAKYEGLKAKTTDNEEFIYDVAINKLKPIKTVDELKDYLKKFSDGLNYEMKALQKEKNGAVPGHAFKLEAFQNRLRSFKQTAAIYNEILEFGKKAGFF